jgi:hypothetical protein
VGRGAAFVACLLTGQCFPIPIDVPTRPVTFDARRLEGEWFVVATNFPMWLEGDKKDPRFRYSSFREVDGRVVMDDEVSYLEDGSSERQTIEGLDTQDPSIPAHFTWRGKGFLALFTSEWYVAHDDPDLRFAIIYFTETPATPAGVDVITRNATPSPAVVQAATTMIQSDAFLSEAARGMVWIAR